MKRLTVLANPALEPTYKGWRLCHNVGVALTVEAWRLTPEAQNEQWRGTARCHAGSGQLD